MNIIVPGVWGLTAFGDVGRAWLDGESSDTCHAGVANACEVGGHVRLLPIPDGVHAHSTASLILRGRFRLASPSLMSLVRD